MKHMPAATLILLAFVTTLPMTGCATSTKKPDANAAAVAEVDPFLDAWARTNRFRLGRPGSIRITPDGSKVLFLRSEARSFVHTLYEFDVATGTERVLLTAEQILQGAEENLSPEEKARRERQRQTARGIAGYSLTEDGNTIVTSLSGRLFLVDRVSAKVREITSISKQAAIDPQVSKDGRKLAHCRGNDLHVTDLRTGVETVVARSESPTVTYGQAEFVAQEEMDRDHGTWFSPDASMVAVQRTDTAGMEMFHIADPTDPTHEPETWPYPRAGGKNAVVGLEVRRCDGSGTPVRVQWDAEKYPYMARVTWKEHAPLMILVQNRAQTEQVLLAVDHATGATREVLRERDDAWLELAGGNPRVLPDGTLLWLTEKDAGWVIEHRRVNGELIRAVNEPEMGLGSIGAVSEDGTSLLVSASSDPTMSHSMMLPIGKGERVQLTSGAGRFGTTISRDFTTMVRTSSWLEPGKPDTWEVLRNGVVVGQLRSVQEAMPITPRVEVMKVKGEREYYTAVVKPSNFDSRKKYPVVAQIYAGPTALTVHSTANAYLKHQWLADKGYIVVSIDNRGTPGRGRAWSRAVKGNLIDAALDDQVDALQALGQAVPQMDLSRVGVSGWSFGGYFAALAVMKRPDVYACGIAGAPVTDWADYDTHYTERYMGTPQENKAGYEASSVMTFAKDLTKPLLLIHGTSDDNVYFMHSLKLSGALFKSGRDFDFLPLAGFTHMVPDPKVTINLEEKMLRFLDRHLKPSRE
ncbi:MAG: prolyl oligopeptidase family serine peptidase [Planctomycetes bacterium]|nr:prolyl oligopeptidase family serine peptidase [Planctomycetota bacterium]